MRRTRRYEDFTTVGECEPPCTTAPPAAPPLSSSTKLAAYSLPLSLCSSRPDWIQDSLHERTVHVRRGSSRIPPMPASRFIPQVRLVEDTLSWLWHFTLTLLSDGEDWLVVSAVGAFD